MFVGATNIVKNSDKKRYVYSGYGIAFDVKCECSFKNNFLILGEGDTFDVNGSNGAPEKSLNLILVNQTQNFG